MLSCAPGTAYVHEPLNKDLHISVLQANVQYWFPLVNENNASTYKLKFSRLFKYKYPFIENLLSVRHPLDLAKLLRDQFRFAIAQALDRRPILKDPLALFAAPWLSSEFQVEVLVLIRNPFAFCSSLKIKNWSFPFKDFVDQPELMDGLLFEFREDIYRSANEAQSIIDQGILLWNCFHTAIRKYQLSNPNWIFRTHEKLSQDPVNQFRKVFAELDLQFTEDCKVAIRKSTGEFNPAEQMTNNEFIRNSRKNIHNWKSRLTKVEIEKVRKGTAELLDFFYPNFD